MENLIFEILMFQELLTQCSVFLIKIIGFLQRSTSQVAFLPIRF